MKFSMIPLLLTGKSLSEEARLALQEHRLKDVVAILQRDYGLSCLEVGDLLGISACDQ
ncbi:MAG: hypothetical protein ACM3SP_23200 [Chloroflexota bacterium]